MVGGADELSSLVPNAQDLMEKIALAEAEKASAAVRRQAEEEAEKNELIEKLTKPSGVSDEEALKRVAAIIQRAASNGLTEVQVLRFPNKLCTDQGRAINQREPGWQDTLTGLPKEMYQFWDRQLRDRGYKLAFQIVDWPGGMPGDIGITLKWV
jgi:molybdopterin-biosynthesis enzyme MoeA-like protein